MKKMQKMFNTYFHSKRFFLIFRFIILLFFFVIFINFSKLTLSKYSSKTDISLAPNLAFFITDVGSYGNKIALEKIVPSSSPYIYTFTVSNFKDNKRINVNLEYEIEFVTTTNLPLNIKIFKNTEDVSGIGIISSDQIIANDDNMYFRVMKTEDISTFSYSEKETNTYLLYVEFPEVYKYYPDDYEGVIDLFEIKINAKQIL